MGPANNCIMCGCLVLMALVIAQINGQGSVSVEKGVNQFAPTLYGSVSKGTSGNILVSPTGAAIALAMLAYGSGGNTKSQFKKLLDLPSSDAAGASGYRAIIKSLQDLKQNEVKFASRIFINSQSPVKTSYKTLLRTYFDAGAQSINFNKSTEAANIINKWVQNVAKDHPGHIKQTVLPGELGPKTRMVIVDPIYFRGNWKNGFDAKKTQQRPFKVNQKTERQVATMSKTGVFKYGLIPSNKASFVVLPLKGNELSMIIILPNAVDGLAEIEKELQRTSISSLLKNAHNRNVELHLPKFKFNNKIDLEIPLKSAGLTDAFGRHANFSGISNSRLSISKIVQNTHVEVDEEGGDIDAGTSNIESRLALPNPVKFDVNHPFHIFIIRNNKPNSKQANRLILYTGRIIEPKF